MTGSASAPATATAAASVTAREPDVDVELAREHGLSDDEFDLLQDILGPNFTELGIASSKVRPGALAADLADRPGLTFLRTVAGTDVYRVEPAPPAVGRPEAGSE